MSTPVRGTGRAGAGAMPMLRRWVVPARRVHPAAWWLWALALAVVASRTTNPWLLGLVVAVAGYVVAARRTDAPWARSYAAFLRLGLIVIAIRVVVTAVVGAPLPGTVLMRLPEVALPSWALGVRLGGPVTAPSLAASFADGLRLATMLACLGAANALANPRRLLALLPGALYEVGVAVVVALTLAPQLVVSVTRVREARRLRGQVRGGVPGLRWLPGLRRVAMPVLHDALDRSVELAAGMDARGYGRRAPVPAGVRRLGAAATLGGLLGVCVGLYALLDSGSPGPWGLPLLLVGLVAVGVGMRLGGAATVRTRYRPDLWGPGAWAVAVPGLAAALVVALAGAVAPATLAWSTVPLTAPSVPALAMVGVLLATVPAFVPATRAEVP